MKHALKTIAVCGALAVSFAANAQSRHHYENWRYPHVQTSNSDNVVGALLLGGVIGAVIANNTRQQEQQVVIVQQPQPVCFERPLFDQQGRFVTYQKVCQ